MDLEISFLAENLRLNMVEKVNFEKTLNSLIFVLYLWILHV